jgi:hypothetical protein
MSLILSGTDGLSDVDGSAATPAIRGTDANTGIFFGADIIGFAEGGAEVARFNADAQFVAAAGTASLPVITTTGDVNTGIFFPAADTIAFAEGGVESMRIDSSSNVGIGTNSPGAKLAVVSGTSPNIATLQVGFSGSANYYDANLHAFRNGSQTEVARIESGNLLVGNSSQPAGNVKLYVKGTSGDQFKLDNGGEEYTQMFFANNGTTKADMYSEKTTTRFYIRCNGSGGVYLANGATSWTANSDERKKDIIETITDAANKVSTLRAVIGKYKTDAEGTRRSFLIAQDVQAVLPEAVDATTPDDLGVQYSDVIPLLVAAIKEQNQLITTLTDRITALETPTGTQA